MKQSRLELYVDILKALNQHCSPNQIDPLNEFKIDSNALKQCIDFLLKQHLVTKTSNGKQVVYQITEKAKNILRYFNELDNQDFIVDEGIEVANCKTETL